MFQICCVTSCDPIFKGLCQLWEEAPHKRQCLTMFGDHWCSASGDMTSQNLVIERSCNFISGSSILYIPTLSNFLAICAVVVEIKCF